MTHCFYHSADLDGWCSGFLLMLAMERKREPYVMHPFNYGQKVPYNKFNNGDSIIFADVVPSPYSELEVLVEVAPTYNWDITVIDHHASFIEFAQSHLTHKISGELSTRTSACQLTWEHFFSDESVPEFVTLLAQYDSWQDEDKDLWNERIMPFQYGARLYAKDPSSSDKSFWSKLYVQLDVASSVNDVIEDGRICVAYKKQQDERICHAAFEASLHDFPQYKCLCINAGSINSQTFESKWNPDKYDIMLSYSFNGKSYNFSMYTTKDEVDVSRVALFYGGGGHMKASGFQASHMTISGGRIKIVQ
jgi:oligoribonuclease NrnB/cAMP/cGMP phosphodiesterase (DHH superfamily)